MTWWSKLIGVCLAFINTLRPRQNGRHFAGDIFKCILLNENVWITIKISLKFVPKGLTNNIPAMVQIMAWHRSGDKPLYEPIMVSILTHICVSRPQWVNPEETSWDLLGPMAYKSHHCVSVRNCFPLPLKRYVFLKNIVLHNIVCETNWIEMRTQFYILFWENVTQKPEKDLADRSHPCA